MASTPPERWRTSPSYPAYEVSDQGRVRRVKPGKGARVGRILTPARNGGGYLTFSVAGVGVYVHVLVAEAFLGPLPPGGEVDHLDGDKANPRLSNLKVHPSRLAHQERHRRRASDRRRHGDENVEVPCGCGCGARLFKFAPNGRPRRFVHGHNARLPRAA